MGIMDAFSAEERVPVKFSDFYTLMKGCTERDLITNAVNARVPHEYIIAMQTGAMPEKEDTDG